MSETVVWIDPDGATTIFSKVEYGINGRWFPSTVIDEEQVPGQPGSRLREVRHGPLEFVMPVWIQAGSATALRTALRNLVYAMDPTRGPGRIRVTAPGGDQRELACIVVDGLEMAERLGSSSTPTDQKLVLAFRAHDPYWTAVSDIVQDFTIGTQPSFFPFFPLRLTASEIAVDTTIDNGGDVDAWPVWTITGPGSGIVLRNLGTGKNLTPSGLTLAAGDTMVVDTRPGAKTVTKGDGTNLWPFLTSASALWPLRRGPNAMRLEMATTTAASGLRLSYRPRYLSV